MGRRRRSCRIKESCRWRRTLVFNVLILTVNSLQIDVSNKLITLIITCKMSFKSGKSGGDTFKWGLLSLPMDSSSKSSSKSSS